MRLQSLRRRASLFDAFEIAEVVGGAQDLAAVRGAFIEPLLRPRSETKLTLMETDLQNTTAEPPPDRSSTATARVTSRVRRPPHKAHAFFIAFTAIFGLLVLAGFFRTFFIPVARGNFSRPIIVHIHGALFFAWTFLLFAQAVLAATRRLRLHRAIGSFAGWLVIPMVVLGTVVAARDTVHDFYSGDGEAAVSFFYGELADLAMFGLLAGTAMLLRNKPDFHKRWVILGSLGLLGAAVGRIHELKGFASYIDYALIASVALYDLDSRRRIHPATLMGAAVLLGFGLTEESIGATRAWITTAHYVLKI